MGGGISEPDYCWYRFGHDIAGPVCWTFAHWIRNVVDHSKEYSDIAFVARDGYLVKKMFDKLPGKYSIKTHYIYAPRILAVLLQETYTNKDDVQHLSKEEKDKIDQVYELKILSADEQKDYISLLGNAYRNYLGNEGFGNKKIYVVDSTTDNLSSQKLVSRFNNGQETCGLYWYATQNAFSLDYEMRTCQKEHYMVVESPDLFELIFKDPFPPLKRFMPNGIMEYHSLTDDEANRIHNFQYIENGAMDFFTEAESKKVTMPVEADSINKYLIDYCKNPSASEKEIIEMGHSSGGIANDQWTRTRVFIGKQKKLTGKSLKKDIKRMLAVHPKIYVFLRRIYHKIRHI